MKVKITKKQIRWLFGVFSAFALPVMIMTGCSNLIMAQRRGAIVKAIEGADSLILNEFIKTNVITRVNVPSAQAKTLTAAFPFTGAHLVPFTIKLCRFRPRHGIQAEAGKSVTHVLVCFACEQIKINDGRVFDIPPRWRQSLHSLFEASGIPIRSDEEYLDIEEKMVRKEKADFKDRVGESQ